MNNPRMQQLFKRMVEMGASDLHLTAGSPPTLRINEELCPEDQAPLKPEEARAMAYELLSSQQIETFERDLEMDMSFGLDGLGRFRVNVFMQRGAVSAAIRLLPSHIRTFQECGLPVKIMEETCKRKKGLILITGATGSGKSTTLASIVGWINATRPCHVITVEDPIEYIHKNQKAIVDQRELGADTHSFPAALKHILREDPNVILIGEMRDLETIESALNIAETGHLVLATLHTSDAIQSINRIVDVFPANEKEMIRTMLSESLRAVISQTLLKKSGGGRVAAHEIMIGTPAIRNLIREGKIAQMYSAIQTGQAAGMQTLDQNLQELLAKSVISKEEARFKAANKDQF